MTENRKFFDELLSGIEEVRDHRAGKITLQTHKLSAPPPLRISAATIRETRELLNVSRAVFAAYLGVSARTLENWEQERAKPNAQAAALILMVRKYPDTLTRLKNLGEDAA